LLVDGSADDALVQRIRDLFDLDADPRAIKRRLGTDGLLSFRPGIRVPGCLDPFELALRAVVGQQISVPAASTFMGRIHSTFGLAPVKLAEADLTTIGLTRSRAETVRSLAGAVLQGGLQLDRLNEIRGIGPWTVQYIAMRAFKDADAFPAEDLILRRAASSNGAPLSAKQLIARAEVWRPFRAYAVMSLWRAYVDRQST
jgi:AraC family transcriptional regulator of adaptative response / DNA-3-methyladenine glycosylase II